MPSAQTCPALETIEDYILAAAPEVRPILEKIRQVASAAVPGSLECISYRMPALRRKKVFFYFAAFGKHIGVYPPVKGSAGLQAELAPFRGPKGNLQFPLNQAIPYALIGRVARELADEYGQ
jgi:uncharacterized protein YdhG (YjbR/CyaY superfamily)